MQDLDRWRGHASTAPLADDVDAAYSQWDAAGNTRRLWDADAGLWTGADEARWLGWLHLPALGQENAASLDRFRDAVACSGITDILLLGMGGSSLCPEVWSETFAPRPGFPKLHVLDSTDPAQIRALESRVDPERTLYIVASKSGTTLEPSILKAYFFERARQRWGAAAGERFVAITDPGSRLEEEAARDGFRAVFPGVSTVGGRFSALSNFGLVPAAAMGLDVARLLRAAAAMAAACGPEVAARDNPGIALGLLLAVCARRGRDKLTLVASPGIHALGGWLEQLLAESTGKQGRAIVPVDGEALAAPEFYGQDRLFVALRLESAPDPAQDAAVAMLERAGHPVVRLAVPEPDAIAAEFFRWEIATAAAGAALGIHPFDQPDVEASKVATRALTAEYEASGTLSFERPFFGAGPLQLIADAANVDLLESEAGRERTLTAFLRAHLQRLGPSDYFALLAYLAKTPAHEALLQRLRHRVRDHRRVATCLGFGPRFLHSTGQAYKGGPNTGVFLQLSCEDRADLPVPGQRYTFGIVKAAQARGDFEVLARRGRRLLRVHLGPDVQAGLEALDAAVAAALAGL